MKKIVIDNIEYPYFINKNGEVYNKFNKKLNPYLTHNYPTVTLYNNNQKKRISIHRLLAMTYIDNPKKYTIVRHLNDNTLDFRLSNLAWGDYDDNVSDAQFNNKILKGSKKPNNKLSEENVKYIYINPDKKTQKELSEMFNISFGSISQIHRGVKWTHITKDLQPMWRSSKNGKGFICSI